MAFKKNDLSINLYSNPKEDTPILIKVVSSQPPEKYESQIGSSSQLLGKIIQMFQTTNQNKSLLF